MVGTKDEITLITRPRRFGKTLNMSMLNCFFSNQFTGREDPFKGLAVWKKEKYRKMQGTYPVIFLSFAAIKGSNYEDARDGIIMAINEAYSEHRYLLESNELTDGERKCFEELDYYAKNPGIKKQVANDTICNAVKNLANCMSPGIIKRKLLFCWMNMIPRCRKLISMDIGKNLQHLSEVYLMQRLRQIHIWKEQ